MLGFGIAARRSGGGPASTATADVTSSQRQCALTTELATALTVTASTSQRQSLFGDWLCRTTTIITTRDSVPHATSGRLRETLTGPASSCSREISSTSKTTSSKSCAITI